MNLFRSSTTTTPGIEQRELGDEDILFLYSLPQYSGYYRSAHLKVIQMVDTINTLYDGLQIPSSDNNSQNRKLFAKRISSYSKTIKSILFSIYNSQVSNNNNNHSSDGGTKRTRKPVQDWIFDVYQNSPTTIESLEKVVYDYCFKTTKQ